MTVINRECITILRAIIRGSLKKSNTKGQFMCLLGNEGYEVRGANLSRKTSYEVSGCMPKASSSAISCQWLMVNGRL